MNANRGVDMVQKLPVAQQHSRFQRLSYWVVVVLIGMTAALRWHSTDFSVPYFGGDTIYPLDPAMNFSWLFSMWDTAQFGQPSLFPVIPIFLGGFEALHALGLNLGQSQHVYEWLAAFVGAVVVGRIAVELAPFKTWHPLLMLLGAIAYLWLPDAVYLPLGWWTTVGVPLAVLGAIRSIRARDLRVPLLWGLIGAFANLCLLNDAPNFEMQAVLILWVLLFVGVALVIGIQEPTKVLLRLAVFAVVSIGALLPVIIGTTWQIAAAYGASVAITAAKVGPGGTYGDYGNSTFPNVLTLLSYYPQEWQNAVTRFLAFVPALLSAIAFRRAKNNPWIAGITAATVFCIVITIGPNAPIAPIYQWFMTHVPGALAFRTVGKIHLFVAMGYAILAPIGAIYSAMWFYERITSSKRSTFCDSVFSEGIPWKALGRRLTSANARLKIKVLSLASRFPMEGAVVMTSAIAFIAILAVLGKPIWTGETYLHPVSPLTQARNVPQFYYQVGEYLRKHAGRTLVFPEQGYTQEVLASGVYFGPSLSSYALPRTTVFSPLGSYGQPATAELKSIYASMQRTIDSVPVILTGPYGLNDPSINVTPGDVLEHHDTLYRWLPRGRSKRHELTLIFSKLPSTAYEMRVLTIQVSGTGMNGAAIVCDGKRLGIENNLVPSNILAYSIPLRRAGEPFRLSFIYRQPTDRFSPRARPSLAIIGTTLTPTFRKSFITKLLNDGIQYIFFDGAAQDPRTPRFGLAVLHNAYLTPIMADSRGRTLIRVDGTAHEAYLVARGLKSGLRSPTYGDGSMSVSFYSPAASDLVLKQNYSPLWRYRAIRNGGAVVSLTAVPGKGGSETIIRIARSGQYRIDGFFLPQAFLIAQYVLFVVIGLALAALATIECRRRSHVLSVYFFQGFWSAVVAAIIVYSLGIVAVATDLFGLAGLLLVCGIVLRLPAIIRSAEAGS